MQIIKIALSLLTIIAFSRASAQKETITYELNGRNITDASKNPFAKFIGEWTLKNDKWTHNWGEKTETIQIPNHHTVSKQINTDNTLFSIIAVLHAVDSLHELKVYFYLQISSYSCCSYDISIYLL